MQNGAQNVQGRLLGFVRVVVGGRAFDLPIQAMIFEKDLEGSEHPPGGFFADGAELGILVDDTAPEAMVRAQIKEATVDAVRHLSRRVLN
jgi:hypothetical protein